MGPAGFSLDQLLLCGNQFFFEVSMLALQIDELLCCVLHHFPLSLASFQQILLVFLHLHPQALFLLVLALPQVGFLLQGKIGLG